MLVSVMPKRAWARLSTYAFVLLGPKARYAKHYGSEQTYKRVNISIFERPVWYLYNESASGPAYFLLSTSYFLLTTSH